MEPRLDVEIQRARTGDRRAFGTVTEILGPALIRFVTWYMGGDHHAANDVVQETFLAAWRNIDHLPTAEILRPWLYHVAKCKAASWIRRRSPPGTRCEPIACDGSPEPYARSHVDPDAHDAVGALRRALEGLPKNYAGPVQLYYLHGLTTGETARLLGLTRTTVKMRLHRARHYLRRTMMPPPPGTEATPARTPRNRRSHP